MHCVVGSIGCLDRLGVLNYWVFKSIHICRGSEIYWDILVLRSGGVFSCVGCLDLLGAWIYWVF